MLTDYFKYALEDFLDIHHRSRDQHADEFLKYQSTKGSKQTKAVIEWQKRHFLDDDDDRPGTDLVAPMFGLLDLQPHIPATAEGYHFWTTLNESLTLDDLRNGYEAYTDHSLDLFEDEQFFNWIVQWKVLLNYPGNTRDLDQIKAHYKKTAMVLFDDWLSLIQRGETFYRERDELTGHGNPLNV